METESVRSELSSRSRRSSRHRHNTHRSTRSTKSQRKESGDNIMAPFQTSININPETGRDGQEVIEVQILPQDENWGENTTAVTGNTSEGSQSMEDVSNWAMESDGGLGFVCSRYFGTTLALGLTFVAFISPLTMVVLPKIGFFPGLSDNILQPSQQMELLACTAECKGVLLSLAFKLVLLAIGVWAAFLRPRNAILPRIFVFRAVTLVMIAVCTFSYWLFYIVQITEATKAIALGEDATDYKALVTYVSSFADTLLFIHYVAVILIEIRHLEPNYYIKIVRSPDGESRSYAIGQLSIQRAAVWVLQRYYTEFPIYNPYLEKIPISKSQRKAQSSIKFYDVDGSNTNAAGQTRSTAGSCAGSGSGRRRESVSAHNERYHEEAERERRVRKRRARLLAAADDAFAHVRRVRLSAANGGALGPREAAQAVFPSLARALQKYLRATRQQPRHTADSVLAHLARCLSQDASPRAFLEPFLVEGPVLAADHETRPLQRWSLISDELLARPLAHNIDFQLRQGDVSLICSIKQLPKFSLSEEVVDPKSNRFVLRLNSETSV
ncbi:vang-like protein 1 [Bombyx mandarina]|uniref:Vang-like protein n=1 Tax=Bombyx mandarina TaxID=7092 RepID=A0A6J2JGC3_BOMMA|nr:vang-like protein 1 [Bombyx mandarina]